MRYLQILVSHSSSVKIFAGCVTIPVHSTDPTIGPSPEDLEKAAASAEAKGVRVRILLITNPNNPLGTIYPPTVIKSAIDWARSRSMHTIVDEVYALGCHEVSQVLFFIFQFLLLVIFSRY